MIVKDGDVESLWRFDVTDFDVGFYTERQVSVGGGNIHPFFLGQADAEIGQIDASGFTEIIEFGHVILVDFAQLLLENFVAGIEEVDHDRVLRVFQGCAHHQTVDPQGRGQCQDDVTIHHLVFQLRQDQIERGSIPTGAVIQRFDSGQDDFDGQRGRGFEIVGQLVDVVDVQR